MEMRRGYMTGRQLALIAMLATPTASCASTPIEDSFRVTVWEAGEARLDIEQAYDYGDPTYGMLGSIYGRHSSPPRTRR